MDPAQSVTHRIRLPVGEFCRQLARKVPRRPQTTYAASWQVAQNHALQALSGGIPPRTEPWIARQVAALLQKGARLVVANSMPIRDTDAFADQTPRTVFANRGASGIDGTVATASGVALASRAPVALLIGDLALLHDMNSMALLKDHDQPVVIVCVNNDGGGIFSLLPISKFDVHFERCFGTPHGLRFKALAQMFGARYSRPASAIAFDRQLQRGLRTSGLTLIEVQTSRTQNARLHRRLQERVRRALERLV